MARSGKLLFLLLLLPGTLAMQTYTPTPNIPHPAVDSPAAGQAVLGNAPVTGSTAVEGFASAELAFAYQYDPTNTWFLIAELSEPVQGGTLASWDTTTLNDGNYNLRLTVFYQDGSSEVFTSTGLRVRNYTPIETNTPTPPLPTETPQAGETPLPATASITPMPSAQPPMTARSGLTATPLPTNPAQLSQRQVFVSTGKGALAIVGIFALSGIYYLARARRLREEE